MSRHEVEVLIEKADKAIVEEDFDTVMNFYSEDAMLVIRPDRIVHGKKDIRTAMEKIAEFFKNSIGVEQRGMKVLEAGDTALVLANTVITSSNFDDIVRKATYVFKKVPDKGWLCIIDNSYGHELLSD